jgi:hypothetical protein
MVKAHKVAGDGNGEAMHSQIYFVVTRFRADRGVGAGAEISSGSGTGGFILVVDTFCEGEVQVCDERGRRSGGRGSGSGVCAGVLGGGHCDVSDGDGCSMCHARSPGVGVVKW